MMPDMETIEADRAVAGAALTAAEAAMEAGSGDPLAFAQAKHARQAAMEALERLEWAEQAERKRKEQALLEARQAKLREVQGHAVEAHGLAADQNQDLGRIAAELYDMVKVLRSAQDAVNIAVNHETFAVRDGLLPRATIESRVKVDREAVITTLRAAQELCSMAGMSRQAAEQQAAARRI